MRGRVLLVALSLITACHPCDPVSELRVGGETPYVRCAELSPPQEGRHEASGVAFEIEERELRFDAAPAKVAFLRGPAPGAADLGSGLLALVQAGASLFVVLGGVGDDASAAEHTLRALGATGRPVLVLAGGRDEADALTAAFEAVGDDAPGVIDARGLRVAKLGPTSLVLLSGAPEGHYARTADACGFGSDDLDALREAVPASGPRYLVSWAAPASDLTFGFDHVQAGDATLAELVESAGLLGGISAWPALAAGGLTHGEGGALTAVVGALGAPHARSADGAVLADQPLVLSLGPSGFAPVAAEPTP